jgi:hypothetical protein
VAAVQELTAQEQTAPIQSLLRLLLSAVEEAAATTSKTDQPAVLVAAVQDATQRKRLQAEQALAVKETLVGTDYRRQPPTLLAVAVVVVLPLV